MRNFHSLLLTIGCMLPLALGAQGASAQGFMVQPMSMQANPAPTQTVELPLKIYNTAVDGPRTILLRAVDLSQDEQGIWQLVEPASGIDVSGHASSLAWTTLSTDRAVIGPQQPADIVITLRPPANARGYYFAGIVAETPIPENAVGVVVRTRFLIPLIIEIRGRSVRQHVGLTDVGMSYLSPPGAPPTTVANMSISNTGQTYSRVRGELSVESQSGSQWRVVTRLPVNEKGIIPGVALRLGGDLERRLPNGTYRLHAELFVDGRRTQPLEKVIQFEGDPNARLAYDSTLLLQPTAIDVRVVPGATRTAILSIESTSPDPVTIAMNSRTPRALVGVQMGNVLGANLSAEPWTTIEPSTFTLRPNGSQNVRVVSAVPANGIAYPNYYADLVLKGTYADGQSAGETFSTIHLANTAMKSAPAGQIEKVSLSENDDLKFVAELLFDNIGDVDFVPVATVTLISPQGAAVTTQVLSGEPGKLLPLGKRTFSGEIDLSTFPPGEYSLVASVKGNDAVPATAKYPLTIGTEDFVGSDGKTLSMPTVSLSDTAVSTTEADHLTGATQEQQVTIK